MKQGNIGVTTENIFPIIKKFLYSDHEIFLRELVSNAVDATQKLKTLASVGEYKGELGDITVRVIRDEANKTITISDKGIGMTAEEIDKYINQIAFSGAEEFLDKYKNDAAAIIGHFGLGFYSSFMVAKKVEIITKSHKENSQAVKWSCEGNPDYTIEEIDKADRGTDIVLHIDDENLDFLQQSKINDLLTKYCKFLPIPIAFGKKTEWKEGKQVDTDEDNIINDTQPAWVRKPTELTEEDYQKFYRDLYPMSEDPLFHIHLNVDYPFNLTGILYFPKVKNNIDLQKNKIQLYCNQVFVTDSVEGIVPDFLTLLHGVIDSPDIPLNVSRSYLQSDGNVKKISSHITKKVADRLQDIFKTERPKFEEKWESLKIFINYGMLTDDKFYERAEKFNLLKNVDGTCYTAEEYKKLIESNQTDKKGEVIYLYANNKEEQFSYIEAAKGKGYDVLLMDGQLDVHIIAKLEQKWEKSRFVRVDSDIAENLIEKEDRKKPTLTDVQQKSITEVFSTLAPKTEKANYIVTLDAMTPAAMPVLITQNEFMRRMKEMSAMQGGMMSFYGDMPDSYNLVVNTDHPIVQSVLKQQEESCGKEVSHFEKAIADIDTKLADINKQHAGKKEDELPQEIKDEQAGLRKEMDELRTQQKAILANFADGNNVVKQLIDLALLANNMLKGEALNKFVKRSADMILP
jgi:molecular chaperone HtpG